MNRIFVFAAVVLLAVAPFAAKAQEQAPAPAAAAVPALQAQPQPQAAAPEATNVRPAWLEYHPSYTGEENDMANPNRTHEEISTWAQQAAADVLSFSKDEYKAKMASFQKYFVPQGWKLYTAYLNDSKAINMVGLQDFDMVAIVDELPEIVNKGAAGGVYHWIVRMPVTISFHKRDADGGFKRGPTGKFFLFVDIARVGEGQGDHGIAISNWRVMDVPKR